jgi:hypothetical protein
MEKGTGKAMRAENEAQVAAIAEKVWKKSPACRGDEAKTHEDERGDEKEKARTCYSFPRRRRPSRSSG